MGWEFAHGLDIGGRSEQQDSYSILEHEKSYLLVLADGMGGKHQGAMASATVMEIAHNRFYSRYPVHPEQFLKRLCMAADRKIRALSKNQDAGSGSTLVVLYLQDKEAYWAHVGDSRLYHFQNGKRLYQTVDHSLVELQKQGAKFAHTAQNNQLYMCLAGDNGVNPEINRCGTRPDDIFLLCSDGLWNEMTTDEILAQLSSPGTLQQHADTLIRIAANRGGRNADNISLIIGKNKVVKPLSKLLNQLLLRN